MELADRNLKKGIQLFKQQKYTESVNVFGSVIHAYQDDFRRKKIELEKVVKNKESKGCKSKPAFNKNYVNALDCISACYLKLNDPERALKHAKLMVSVQPVGCKGYLRLSKVYAFINDNQKAYDVLKRGYLKIKESKDKNQNTNNDPLYKQLKDELRKFKANIGDKEEGIQCDGGVKNEVKLQQPTPTKDLDPLKLLPMELIINIFSQFPLTFNLECLTVCNYWYETLLHSPHVFENYHLKKNIRKQEFISFFKFIDRVYHGQNKIILKSVNIEPHESVEKSIITLFFNKSLTIKELKIDLKSINYFGLRSIIRNGKIFFSNLKALNLRIPLFINETTTLEDLLKLCENLEKLVITIPKFDNRSKSPVNNFITLSKLKFLSVTVERDVANSNFNSQLLTFFLSKNSFPKLKHLVLSRVNIKPEMLQPLITNKLQSLELDSIPRVSIVHVLDAMLLKGRLEDGILRDLKIIELETTFESSHRDWKNELMHSKILSNLNVLMLRNSCITPSLLDDMLLCSLCHLNSLHLVLNRNIVFQNRLSNVQSQYEPANISNLILKIPNIEELTLAGCPGFNKLTLNELISKALSNHLFDKLHYLNLSMSKIDNNSLLQIFRKPFNLKLEKLVIQYCEVSPDAVRFLLENKLCKSIDYKMSDRVIL